MSSIKDAKPMKWFFGALNLLFALIYIPIFWRWIKDIFQKDSRKFDQKNTRFFVRFSNLYLGVYFCMFVVSAVLWFLS